MTITLLEDIQGTFTDPFPAAIRDHVHLPRSEKIIRGDDSMAAYVRDMSRFPLLSAEEEYALFQRVRAGDYGARCRIVEANTRLAVFIARRYASKYYDVPLLDLIQYANLGLLHAVDKFDPQRGTRFSTYAYWWIHQVLRRELCHEFMIILPAYQQERLTRIKRMAVSLEQRLGCEPTLDELAEATELSVADIAELEQASAPLLSLDEPLDTGKETTLGSLLSDETDTETEATEHALNQEIEELCRALLPTRERHIVQHRYGLWGAPQLTLEAIGEQMGLTRERVRQLEQQALRRLRGSGLLHQLGRAKLS